MAKVTFRLSVLNANKLIYQGEVTSVIALGDQTEYEVLPYHSPLLGVLRTGDIIVDNRIAIPVAKGLIKFYENECVILAEEKKKKMSDFKGEVYQKEE